MKPACFAYLLLLCLAACTGKQVTPTATPFVLPTDTLQPGEQLLETCGFSIAYPADLQPDGAGYRVLFLSETEPEVSFLVSLRRRTGYEQAATPENLALNLQLQYFPQVSSVFFVPLLAVDELGQPVQGLQRDLPLDDMHTRLVMFLRPDGLLGDQLPGDVIYDLVARAPEESWAKWGPLFGEMIQSLQPRDCGGT